MLKIFLGMIIGNITAMMLLGGPSATNQVLANIQTLYVDQINRPDTPTTILLLGMISILLGTLSMWPTKPVLETKQVIKRLRRHCK